MRRLALSLLLAPALVLVATAGATPSERIACGIKSLDFYFWPRGHAAVPELGFPDLPTPHLEVYMGAPPGKLGHQLA